MTLTKPGRGRKQKVVEIELAEERESQNEWVRASFSCPARRVVMEVEEQVALRSNTRQFLFSDIVT